MNHDIFGLSTLFAFRKSFPPELNHNPVGLTLNCGFAIFALDE